MTDAVRPHMRRARRFERTAPAAVILALGQMTFRAATGKLELEPDRQRDDIVLQAFGFDPVELPEQLAHVHVADEVGGFARRIGRHMSAGIGTIGPIAPHLGQVEHLAQDAEDLVRFGRLVRELLHHARYVMPFHVLYLLATQQRNDAAVDDAIPKGLMGVISGKAGSSFGKHRHRLNPPNPLINLLYRVMA